jgi:signal transduction histidine kinase
MGIALRPTGLNILGDIPWGGHVCCFYATPQDLLDTLVPYLKTGLEHHEFCLWVTSPPLTPEDAARALRHAVPDLDRFLAERRIEILPHDAWYLHGARFDLQRVMAGWKDKIEHALAHGYAGLRLTGDTSWLQQQDWRDFRDYEDELDVAFADQPMIAICTYSLSACTAADLLDVARIHQVAIARRHGKWDVVETTELQQTKAEIERLNAVLEQRVAERTSELAATNAALQRQITERKQAEAERVHLFEQVRASRAQLQVLSRRLLQAQEADRRAIARELHDEIGQTLTSISLMLTSIQPLPTASTQTRLAQAQTLVRNLMDQVRNLALNLRPAVLDDFGLVPALVWLFERYTTQTSIVVRFEHRGLEEQRFAPDVETAAYRIVQEALTNVARHAGVGEATVRLWTDADTLMLVIADAGRGFDPQIARTHPSTGLAGMHERAVLLGGEVTIESALGSGARVIASLPLYSTGESGERER